MPSVHIKLKKDSKPWKKEKVQLIIDDYRSSFLRTNEFGTATFSVRDDLLGKRARIIFYDGDARKEKHISIFKTENTVNV